MAAFVSGIREAWFGGMGFSEWCDGDREGMLVAAQASFWLEGRG